GSPRPMLSSRSSRTSSCPRSSGRNSPSGNRSLLSRSSRSSSSLAVIMCFLSRLPKAAINSHLLECTGQGREFLVAEPLHEQLANTAQVDGRRLRQSGDAGVGQPDDDAAPVRVGVGSRDQSFVDEAIDAAGHARPRTTRLGRKLAGAPFSAPL